MSYAQDDQGNYLIPVPGMIHLAREIFSRAGCDDAEAATIATRLTGANQRGHDSHGVIRIPRYVVWIDEGRQVPNQTVDVIQDSGSIVILDGKFGFGQSLGEQAVDIGIARAKEHGVAITGLRHAGHLGRIGDWSERAAAENIVSIHMVNVRGSLIVAPFGGISKRMSTSPISAGIPVTGQEPIILDMATSTVAEGKALVALKGGKPLPGDAIIDGDGQLTADPVPLYGESATSINPVAGGGEGALTTFGAHKGSGLNFLMEMMAGALTGSGCAGGVGETEKRRFCNGMFSIFLDLKVFHSDDGFAEEVKSYVAFLKEAVPATPGGSVLVPGEKERMVKAERDAKGLPIAPDAWNDICTTARNLALSDNDIQNLVFKN
ncbi:MAG: Ldh family oxidoreductase [Pseudomonadota bacterium]|nr:Ldh family oxidoreductase [Pseudomonadota bacterium]